MTATVGLNTVRGGNISASKSFLLRKVADSS